jgi:hypothetical protein
MNIRNDKRNYGSESKKFENHGDHHDGDNVDDGYNNNNNNNNDLP